METEIDECVDSYFSDVANGSYFADPSEYAHEYFGDGTTADRMDGDDLIEAAQNGMDEVGGSINYREDIRQKLVEFACLHLSSKAMSEIEDELNGENLQDHPEVTSEPDGKQVKEMDDEVFAYRDDDGEFHFWRHVNVRGYEFWVNADDDYDADSIMVMGESLEDEDDEEAEAA